MRPPLWFALGFLFYAAGHLIASLQMSDVIDGVLILVGVGLLAMRDLMESA